MICCNKPPQRITGKIVTPTNKQIMQPNNNIIHTDNDFSVNRIKSFLSNDDFDKRIYVLLHKIFSDMSTTVFTEKTLDAETGELGLKRWITKEAKNKEHFVLMYIDDLCKVKKLSHVSYRILTSLVIYLEYNTNEFSLNPKRKQEIADLAGLKFNTVNQNISLLVKKNVLIKVSGSTYQMNPLLFFKGDELARSKMLEFAIRYVILEDEPQPKTKLKSRNTTKKVNQ